MTIDPQITVTRSDPRRPENQVLIEALDTYMLRLYPEESTHRVDVEVLASTDARFFSALLNSVTVGCGAILLQSGYAEIKRVYVSPPARGRGVGQRILERLEQEALSLDRDALRLETGINQPEALALFEAFGFATRSHFGGYPTDDCNSIFMEKYIGAALS